MHIFIGVKNIGLRAEEVIEELGEDEGRFLVFFTRGADFFLHLHILTIELLVLFLTLLELLLDFIKFVF